MADWSHIFMVDGFQYIIEKTSTPHTFTLNGNFNSRKICRIVGMESTIFGKKEMHFEPLKPIGCFPNPADRIAIRETIAYLKKEHEAH